MIIVMNVLFSEVLISFFHCFMFPAAAAAVVVLTSKIMLLVKNTNFTYVKARYVMIYDLFSSVARHVRAIHLISVVTGCVTAGVLMEITVNSSMVLIQTKSPGVRVLGV